METKNAVIKSAKLTTADHGLLSAWIMLDYGGSGQGFGGHSLYLPRSFKGHGGQVNIAGHFIWRVLEVAGVTEWSQLPGKTIRVRGSHGGIDAIGHIIKDDWFVPDDEFAVLMEKKAAADSVSEELGRRAAVGKMVMDRFEVGGPNEAFESITLSRADVVRAYWGQTDA